MNEFRFWKSPGSDGSHVRKLGVTLAVAATAAAVSAGMLVNHVPSSAGTVAQPDASQLTPPPPAADPSLPRAADVMNAIAGHPDQDAPTF
jgi:hypothetical protein